MAKMTASFSRATASTTLSIGSWVADATRPRRLRLSFASFGSAATPADQTYVFQVGLVTAAGTSTAVTPRNFDGASATTESDAGENHSVDATYSGEPFVYTPCHQRNTLVIYFPEGGEPVSPATASNGFGFKTPVSTGTAAVDVTAHVIEE